MIEELRLVTERKFPAKRKFLDRFFMELPFELVYTPKEPDLNEFPEMRDVKDSPILATAIMEGIDVFLTGDKDFFGVGCRNTRDSHNERLFGTILKMNKCKVRRESNQQELGKLLEQFILRFEREPKNDPELSRFHKFDSKGKVTGVRDMEIVDYIVENVGFFVRGEM